jgi:hypothetical protein
MQNCLNPELFFQFYDIGSLPLFESAKPICDV